MKNSIEFIDLQSVQGPYRLRLSHSQPKSTTQPGEYLTVELTGPHLAASSSRVYLYDPAPFIQFFEEMAEQWRGWNGVKHWHSVERDFDLKCSSDGLGHITIEVTLCSGPYPEDWTVSAMVSLEAGQLHSIATQIRNFIQSSFRRIPL